MGVCNYKCINGTVMFVGVVLVVAASIVLVMLPDIIHKQVVKEIPFVNGTEAYDRWEKLSVPMSYSYYFFQPINPEVFLTSPESVEYEELGPFVFEENFTKIDAQFEDDETRVVYKEERTYAFQEHLSVPNITMDSEIYMFIGFMFGFGFQKQTLSGVLQQIMDPVGDPGNLWKSGSGYTQTAFTGKGNADRVGQITQIRGNSTLHQDKEDDIPLWRTDGQCNAVAGTDGTQFKPGVTKDDTLWVFETTLNRKFKLKSGILPDQEIEDIPTIRFVVSDDNYLKNTEIECYCLESNATQCPEGILDISKTPAPQKLQANISASPAYFYVNPQLLNETKFHVPKGKTLDLQTFGTYLDVEPFTGTVINSRKIVQMSTILKKEYLQDVPQAKNWAQEKYYIPFFYIVETARIDSANAQKLKDKIYKPKALLTGLLIGAIVLGALLIVIGAACCCRYSKHKH